MSLVLDIFVPGRPITQGSKTARSGRVLDANARSRPWRDSVAQACREGRLAPRVVVDAVAVQLEFRFRRPVTVKGLRARQPVSRDTGDLDKLVRGVFDALVQSGVLGDDSQVVHVDARKYFVDHQAQAGLMLRVATTV